MSTAERVAAALRAIAPDGKLMPEDVAPLNQIAANWERRTEGAPAPTPSPISTDPRWLPYARSKIGQREIRGPANNSWIARGWAKLGATWFNDDETPWCGLFVATVLNEAGLPYPKNFPAANSFRTYGTAVPAQLGAIGVMRRPGGNHVFFIVGQTPSGSHYKALGGNQSNAVTIMDVRKRDVDAIRWPATVPILPRGSISLPVLPAGTILTNMA